MTDTLRKGIPTMRDDITEVYFDLETTGLSARDGDIILTCAFLVPSKPDEVYVFTNIDTPDDSAICVDIRDELLKYDRIVGWNTHGFDLKFINERLRRNSQRPLFHRGSFDMMEHLSRLYPYMSKRQDDWCKAVNAKHQKTPLDIESNRSIGRGEGTPDDWQQLIFHNKEDVLGMHEIWQAVMQP
jgi:uncharacterized protein YprB with RNaseH-like and TPR domain